MYIEKSIKSQKYLIFNQLPEDRCMNSSYYTYCFIIIVFGL